MLIFREIFTASEVEGEEASGEAPAGANLDDGPAVLDDIDFDDGRCSSFIVVRLLTMTFRGSH